MWYDQVEMGWNLEKSMNDGVKRSSVMLACVDKGYQDRPNCMLELRAAKALVRAINHITQKQSLFSILCMFHSLHSSFHGPTLRLPFTPGGPQQARGHRAHRGQPHQLGQRRGMGERRDETPVRLPDQDVCGSQCAGRGPGVGGA